MMFSSIMYLQMDMRPLSDLVVDSTFQMGSFGIIDPMVAAHAGPGLVLVAFFGTETLEEGEILNA